MAQTAGSGPPLLVFTDLDGTLLDHESYDWSPARQALNRLAALGALVVPATSKTRAEVAPLMAALGLTGPAIVENGAGVAYLPGPVPCIDRTRGGPRHTATRASCTIHRLWRWNGGRCRRPHGPCA